MTAKAYSLQPAYKLLSHASSPVQLLHDYPDAGAKMYIDKLVASGDYFVNLAAELDDAARLINNHPDVAKARLRKTVGSLLYLQRHYRLDRQPAAA